MKNLAVIFIVLSLTACASMQKPGLSQNSEPNKTNESSVQSNPGPITSAVSEAEVESRRLAAAKLAADKLAAEEQHLKNQSIYFDFDQSVIKPEYQDVIQQEAAFITAHKNDIVTIEGNTDERGSDEYNLALGDRRANIAVKTLELVGVPATQLRAVSLGEEKPRLTCHEEKCWKEDRRDDFIHNLN